MDFILLAAGRSGSTLLTNYLSSHPNVRCHHEPFNQTGWHRELRMYERPIDALKHMDMHGLSISSYQKFKSALRGVLGIQNGSSLADPFKKNTQIESEGFKLTWSQANPMFDDTLQWLESQNKVKCIFLYRYDYLARYVSYQLARSNRLWHSGSKTHNVTPFTVSLASFEKFCQRQLDIEQKHLNMLARSKTQTFMVSYEEFTKNPISKTNEVLDFIGRSPIKAAEALTNKLVVDDLNMIVINFKTLNDMAFNQLAHNKRLKFASPDSLNVVSQAV